VEGEPLMQPVPIPAELVPENCVRKVFGPPDGDPTGDIRAVEAVVGVVEEDGVQSVRIAMLIELDEGDLERLADCGGFWLTMMANHLHPFSLSIADQQSWDEQ
jgi:hypothetical protein